MRHIGITERGDAALDLGWEKWVKEGNPTILITKDPLKLRDHIKRAIPQSLWKNIILHCTITGMGGTYLEPNVPPFDENKNEYINIKKSLPGIARVILRFDPVIPVEPAFTQQIRVLKFLAQTEYFDEVITSFIDNYPHIREKVNLPWDGLHAPLETRLNAFGDIFEICETRGLPLRVCGEPNLMKCGGCVNLADIKAFGLDESEFDMSTGNQRPVCSCIAAKKELLNVRHPCAHNCAYCYWQ